MPASLTQVLMGHGSWSLPVKWDAEVYAELKKYRHVLIYQGERQVGPPLVVLKRKGDEERGIEIGGHDILWHGGSDGKGPIIRDRRYASGRNKLSNPSFELGSGDFEGGGDLHWKTREDSTWVFTTGEAAHTGVGAAITSGNSLDNDVLESEESFEARPGDRFRSWCWVRRFGGIIGRLRLQLIFEGRFNHPDLTVNGDFEDGLTPGWANTSEFLPDVAVEDDPYNAGQKSLRIGPTTRKQPFIDTFAIVTDPETAPPSGWTPDGGAGSVWRRDPGDLFNGEVTVATDGSGSPPVKWLMADINPSPTTTAALVQPNERYLPEYHAKATSGTDGEAALSLPFFPVGFPAVAAEEHEVAQVRPDGPGVGPWKHQFADFTIPEGIFAMGFAIVVRDHTGGRWNFVKPKLTRIRGNFCTVVQDAPFAITPERTYEVLVLLRTDLDFQIGSLKAKAHYAYPDGSLTVEESSELGTTLNQQMWWRFDFTPPSGAVRAILSLWGYDIEGGSFWAERVLIRDKDRSTHVVEAMSEPVASDWTRLGHAGEIEAPEGTERVRVAPLAERLATGWGVDDVNLVWTSQEPATVAQIVPELLVNEETGDPIGIVPGRITSSEVILKDWMITNKTNRDALDELCTGGLVEGGLEYRLNPHRTLDVGRPDDIFEERNDVILTNRKGRPLLVLEGPDIEEDASSAVSDTYLEGAERESRTGRKFRVAGEAHSELPDAFDWDGNPLRRAQVVSDGDADHVASANEKARQEQEAVNHPAESATLRASDPVAYIAEPIVPGQWVGVYEPDHGFVDESRPAMVEGRQVFPKLTRVRELHWRLGPGFHAVLRDENGNEKEIPGVLWEKATSITLEVGDPPRELV